jgi:hypothetical protein
LTVTTELALNCLAIKTDESRKFSKTSETPEFLKDNSAFIIFKRQRMELKCKNGITV